MPDVMLLDLSEEEGATCVVKCKKSKAIADEPRTFVETQPMEAVTTISDDKLGMDVLLMHWETHCSPGWW